MNVLDPCLIASISAFEIYPGFVILPQERHATPCLAVLKAEYPAIVICSSFSRYSDRIQDTHYRCTDAPVYPNLVIYPPVRVADTSPQVSAATVEVSDLQVRLKPAYPVFEICMKILFSTIQNS